MKISKSFDNSLFETITSDNGTKFALLPKFEKILNCSVYFARPYCSVDKAFVERSNRVLRRKIPKGSLMEIYNQKDIEIITKWMNNYERKSKGFQTPAELFSNCCQLSTNYFQNVHIILAINIFNSFVFYSLLWYYNNIQLKEIILWLRQ